MFQILSMEGPPSNMDCCSCGSHEGGRYKCSDCFFTGLLCLDCCLADHARHPFHRIKRWTGTYFARTTLAELGYVLYLGHGGSRCPSMGEARGGDWNGTLVVVDIGHIHTHNVAWCTCTDAPSKWTQLIEMQLYPGSVQYPRTAFTFRLLDYYQLDATECNTTPQSFCTKLRRSTNKHHPDTVPVSVLTHCGLNSG